MLLGKEGLFYKNWYLFYFLKYKYFFEIRLFENFVIEYLGKG